MMKLASRVWKSGAMLGMVLMLTGTAWGQQSPAQTKMTAPAARVTTEFARQATTEQTPTTLGEEILDVFRLIDQIEEKYPQAHTLLSQLRGKLHLQQRRAAQRLVQVQSGVPASVAMDRQASPQISPRRESLPGEDIYSGCSDLKDRALISALNKISSTGKPLDYTGARKEMFLRLDNRGGEVECVYTGRRVRVANNIPQDRDMNCEHTWPQSLGATGEAKCDLHHLFPTDSKANGIRGSLPFGMVSSANWADGGSKCDGDKFEIRPSHRGNAARAKFYFAMRYGKTINNDEEKTLREWNVSDPVDEAEKTRNNGIENIQHNRNPFVDHPEFVDQVSDF